MTTLTDREIIALTLWGEARGEPIEGKIAVASVLRNRLLDTRWGLSYERVCLSPKQFSCWNASDPNLPKLKELAAQLARGETPKDAVYQECDWIAEGLLRNRFQSNVGKATHYHSRSMLKPPKWAATGEFIGSVRGHLFYEKVA